MSFYKATVWTVLVAFSLLCAWAVAEQGYLAVWTALLEQPATTAVGIDLVIALALALLWMVRDAAARGRVMWPYLLLTLPCGSVGVLLYLALGDDISAPEPVGVSA